MIESALATLQQGKDLSADTMQSLIDGMLQGAIEDSQIASLLLALRDKGECVDELVGAARALRSHMIPIRTHRPGLLDTCGTGGDGAKTFNISTAVAIVAAAAGVPVAKHGNRKITSATGSADVLEQLGIRIDIPRDKVEACIDQLGIGFCFAPLLHPAMRHVGSVRRSLGVPTLFNYLGPLCNPAQAPYQILGVGKQGLHQKIAEALSQLPIQRAIVVRGRDGLDEVTLMDETEVLIVRPGQVTSECWTPELFGLSTIDARSLHAENPEESANVIRSVLKGQRGGPRDIVVANTAAALWITEKVADLRTGVDLACEAIDSQNALHLLSQLAAFTQSAAA